MNYIPLALDTPVESELAHLALLRSAGIIPSHTNSPDRFTYIYQAK